MAVDSLPIWVWFEKQETLKNQQAGRIPLLNSSLKSTSGDVAFFSAIIKSIREITPTARKIRIRDDE